MEPPHEKGLCFAEDVADSERCVSSVLNEASLQQVERNIQQDVESIKAKYAGTLS